MWGVDSVLICYVLLCSVKFGDVRLCSCMAVLLEITMRIPMATHRCAHPAFTRSRWRCFFSKVRTTVFFLRLMSDLCSVPCAQPDCVPLCVPPLLIGVRAFATNEKLRMQLNLRCWTCIYTCMLEMCLHLCLHYMWKFGLRRIRIWVLLSGLGLVLHLSVELDSDWLR